MGQVFVLSRLNSGKFSTRGEISLEDETICETLERGPAGGLHPRIPSGKYPITIRHWASKFDTTMRRLLGDEYRGMLLLKNVPGRSAIEIHPANRYGELAGCIAPGLRVLPGQDDEYYVPGGESGPALVKLYNIVYEAIDVDGNVWLEVKDEEDGSR